MRLEHFPGARAARGLTVLAATVLLLATGCASVSRATFEYRVEDIVELINQGRADELAAQSQTPFLLDGEVIVLSQDLKQFWTEVAKSGFRIKDPGRVSVRFIEASSFSVRELAGTMEVESFFKNYVSPRAAIGVLESGKAKLFFLLDRYGWGWIRLIGFKGPVTP